MRGWMATFAVFVPLAAAVLVGISGQSGRAQPTTASVACPADVTCLEQAWSENDRSWWYTVSQGSRLLPLAWFKALERPTSRERILSDENVRRYNYLPNPISRDNPNGLPVGFAVDEQRDGRADLMCDEFVSSCENGTMRRPWVGLNCAACHTAQFSFGGKSVRIEGGPTLADFQGFTEELLASLEATRQQPDKFDRFAREVLGIDISLDRRAALASELDEQIAWQKKVHAKSATPLRYGFGRLDAQGHILNKVALVLGDDRPDRTPADAPASYPHIWNVSQQSRLQWNGIATNAPKALRLELIAGKETDVGALVRNTGEVLGVFAQVNVDAKSRLSYRSSLRLSNMIDLERLLRNLRSPKWPEEILGAIDWEKASLGQNLFKRENCASCHRHLEAGDLNSPAQEQMQKLAEAKTDLWLACNTATHKSKAGVLEGRWQYNVPFLGAKIGEEDATRTMLANVIVGMILGRADELVKKPFEDVFDPRRDVPSAAVAAGGLEYLPGSTDAARKSRARSCLTGAADILAYKARPLNGIWATAPYLHNGSVPTLYDLLLPGRIRDVVPSVQVPAYLASLAQPAGSTHRPEQFWVGNREFDAGKVGYRSTEKSGAFRLDVLGVGPAPVLGNSNAGHDYGTNLTEAERYQLVEYLKTL